MTPEAKSLKICALVTMFCGLAVIILAIVGMVAGFDAVDAAEAAGGVAGTWLGAHGARSANVPSSVERLVRPALVVALVALALAVVAFALGTQAQLAQAVSVVVVVALALAVALCARRVVKALQRK